MADFFRGWRRKMGLFSLLLSLASMPIWMYALTSPMITQFRPSPTTIDHLVLSKFGFVWDRCWFYDAQQMRRLGFEDPKGRRLPRPKPKTPERPYVAWYRQIGYAINPNSKSFPSVVPESTFNSCGLHFGECLQDGRSIPYVTFVIIPYWLFVLPSALLAT